MSNHPNAPEREDTYIDVTFSVRIGLAVDLSEFVKDDPLGGTQAAAERLLRDEIEGRVRVSGCYDGDDRSPIGMSDLEIFDYAIVVTDG